MNIHWFIIFIYKGFIHSFFFIIINFGATLLRCAVTLPVWLLTVSAKARRTGRVTISALVNL